MISRLALCVALLAAAGCGGSPSSPGATLNLAGTWTGSWVFVTSGVTVTDAVTATLTQSGADVNGTWTAQSGASGQFTNLKATTATSGGLTITQTTIAGSICSVTTTVSGNASPGALELEAGTIPTTAACPWAGAQRFSLRK